MEALNQNEQAKGILLSAQSALVGIEEKIEEKMRMEGDKTNWIDAWRNVYGSTAGQALTTISILSQNIISRDFLDDVIKLNTHITDLLTISKPNDRANEPLIKSMVEIIKEKIDAEIARISPENGETKTQAEVVE